MNENCKSNTIPNKLLCSIVIFDSKRYHNSIDTRMEYLYTIFLFLFLARINIFKLNNVIIEVYVPKLSGEG